MDIDENLNASDAYLPSGMQVTHLQPTHFINNKYSDATFLV